MNSLNEVFEDIFTCGKSIDLLRLCNAKVNYFMLDFLFVKIFF